MEKTNNSMSDKDKQNVTKWWSVIKTIIDIIIAAITAATTTTLMS